eukprot:625431-Amphidinium_carterae.1
MDDEDDDEEDDDDADDDDDNDDDDDDDDEEDDDDADGRNDDDTADLTLRTKLRTTCSRGSCKFAPLARKICTTPNKEARSRSAIDSSPWRILTASP